MTEINHRTQEMKEADITISGQTLNFAQSMTLRVAIEAFAGDLTENGLGDDHHGMVMTESYLRCIREIRTLIAKTAR